MSFTWGLFCDMSHDPRHDLGKTVSLQKHETVYSELMSPATRWLGERSVQMVILPCNRSQ